MRVIKCDRCGKVYEKDGKVINIYDRGREGLGETFDICDDCVKSLIKWTEGEEE